MKRTPLLVLGGLFLLLVVACLFYPDRSNNLLLALAVELVFFIRFAISRKPGSQEEPQNNIAIPKQSSVTPENLYEKQVKPKKEVNKIY